MATALNKADAVILATSRPLLHPALTATPATDSLRDRSQNPHGSTTYATGGGGAPYASITATETRHKSSLGLKRAPAGEIREVSEHIPSFGDYASMYNPGRPPTPQSRPPTPMSRTLSNVPPRGILRGPSHPSAAPCRQTTPMSRTLSNVPSPIGQRSLSSAATADGGKFMTIYDDASSATHTHTRTHMHTCNTCMYVHIHTHLCMYLCVRIRARSLSRSLSLSLALSRSLSLSLALSLALSRSLSLSLSRAHGR